MKKLLSIVLCAAAVSAFGDTTVSLGQVGVTAITNSLKNTIVAVSYNDLAGGTGMVVSNFVKTTNLTVGDQLAIYNGGEYTNWILTQGEGEAKFWAKNDKTFKINANGEQVDGTGPQASDISQAVGTGIWLVRKNPTDQDGKAIPFYIYGRPVANPTSATVAGSWTLVGNPNQESFDLGTDEVVGAKTGDQIVAVDENGLPRYYTFKSGYGWQANVDGKPSSLPKIGAGLGVWILTAENATISW